MNGIVVVKGSNVQLCAGRVGRVSGTLLQTTLDELEPPDLTTALVAMCTGESTDTIIERA